MQDVKVSAKAGEAREATGFDLIQWRRFLLISRLEADRYVQHRPQYQSWISLPASEQNALWTAINLRLDAENIPRINQSVLIWRMSQAMREARRLFCRFSLRCSCVWCGLMWWTGLTGVS
ncbi:hypothetical protein BU16DRAFT_457317 [Lophium mytilinum]|uniref:Uncharacterized protein n=1 Tax=Lophium mytilinum TaxID=390894 RepID=A0A6A6QZV2_9PEZI|nr:hypothetical protein BU16DRAFT_457317 [Lophium mytilinum]